MSSQAVLDKLLGGSNKTNYWALVGAGSAAFIGADLDRASSLFEAAGLVDFCFAARLATAGGGATSGCQARPPSVVFKMTP